MWEPYTTLVFDANGGTQKLAVTTQKPVTTTQKPSVTTQKPVTVKHDNDNIVKTGESSTEMIFIVIMGIAVAVGCGMLLVKKHKRK